MINQEKNLIILMTFLITLGMSACGHTQSRNSSSPSETMTLGKFQKEIHRGMAQGDLVTQLGSPNIITSDGQGLETWVYDKIATIARYEDRKFGVGASVGAGGTPGLSLILGGLGISGSKSSGYSSTSQKTLTVVVKFNKQKQVESFSYHSSQF